MLLALLCRKSSASRLLNFRRCAGHAAVVDEPRRRVQAAPKERCAPAASVSPVVARRLPPVLQQGQAPSRISPAHEERDLTQQEPTATQQRLGREKAEGPDAISRPGLQLQSLGKPAGLDWVDSFAVAEPRGSGQPAQDGSGKLATPMPSEAHEGSAHMGVAGSGTGVQPGSGKAGLQPGLGTGAGNICPRQQGTRPFKV